MDVLAGYFKRLCISGAADRIAALQEQIRELTNQLADGQTTLYYSEAARERLAAQLAQAQQRAADRWPPLRENDPLVALQLSTEKKLREQLELQSAHLKSQAVSYQQKLEQQRVEIADLNRKLLTQNVTQAVKKALDHVTQGMNLLQWEAYTTDLRRQIHHGTSQVTTLTRRVKQLQQQLKGCTPLTSETSSPQKALRVTLLKENQDRPLLELLELPGTLRASVPLSVAKLATRSYSAMWRLGIRTINQLLLITPRTVLEARQVSVKTLDDIEDRLRDLWPQLPPEYFYQTVTQIADDDWTGGVRTQYGRPRY